LGSSCRKSESKREIRIVNNPLLAALLFHHRFWKRRFVYNEMPSPASQTFQFPGLPANASQHSYGK
ncbi:hypothetical protein, partial [Paraburkholderia lacunae]|uniref:hypothetical protein n=1 Tax=Paraburkholderia lacunae TaxID=2211104 RepID=UPI001AD7ED4A